MTIHYDIDISVTSGKFDFCWDVYQHDDFTGEILRDITHNLGGPWSKKNSKASIKNVTIESLDQWFRHAHQILTHRINTQHIPLPTWHEHTYGFHVGLQRFVKVIWSVSAHSQGMGMYYVFVRAATPNQPELFVYHRNWDLMNLVEVLTAIKTFESDVEILAST